MGFLKRLKEMFFGADHDELSPATLAQMCYETDRNLAAICNELMADMDEREDAAKDRMDIQAANIAELFERSNRIERWSKEDMPNQIRHIASAHEEDMKNRIAILVRETRSSLEAALKEISAKADETRRASVQTDLRSNAIAHDCRKVADRLYALEKKVARTRRVATPTKPATPPKKGPSK